MSDGGFRLVHDVLDMQLCDHRGEHIGRVDGLVLELRDGAPARVSTILCGGAVRAERIGGWMRALRRVFGRPNDTSRIPFSAVREVGPVIQVDIDGQDLESMHVERWLAEHVVCRIPGAGGDKK